MRKRNVVPAETLKQKKKYSEKGLVAFEQVGSKSGARGV